MSKCELCGKILHDKYYGSTWRTCWIESTSSGIVKRGVLKGHGFYEPRLTSDELWHLDTGQTDICTDRQGCRERHWSLSK